MTHQNGVFRAAATTVQSQLRHTNFCIVSGGFPVPITTGTSTQKKLAQWISEVRAIAKAHGRERIADSCIGGLLSKSAPDEDGIWPRIAIRDVLEELGTKAIADGMGVGLYNQRGAHFRAVGGGQERELAAKYRGWSKLTAISWPFTSRLLENLALGYDREAQMHDADADVRRRLSK
jgi:hypothetical protein